MVITLLLHVWLQEVQLEQATFGFHLGVSKNRATPKWSGLYLKTLLKWRIWGEKKLFFRKHPWSAPSTGNTSVFWGKVITVGFSPSLPEKSLVSFNIHVQDLSTDIIISCRIPQVLQQTIPTWHHHFVLSKHVTVDFMSLLMNGPIISLILSSSFRLLRLSICSAISNYTQLTTFLFQNSVQPDNHPPESCTFKYVGK